MSASPSSGEPLAAESWRRAAIRAPGIAWRLRLRQLAWAGLIGLGSVPLTAIAKLSLAGVYVPGLLDTGLHAAALACAWIGMPRQWRSAAANEDVLTERTERIGRRVGRLAVLRRLVVAEAGVLVALAPAKALLGDARLQWGWPATLAVAMLLVTWPLERILRAEWREYRRLAAAPENKER